jgi:hypothetical protein
MTTSRTRSQSPNTKGSHLDYLEERRAAALTSVRPQPRRQHHDRHNTPEIRALLKKRSPTTKTRKRTSRTVRTRTEPATSKIDIVESNLAGKINRLDTKLTKFEEREIDKRR